MVGVPFILTNNSREKLRLWWYNPIVSCFRVVPLRCYVIPIVFWMNPPWYSILLTLGLISRRPCFYLVLAPVFIFRYVIGVFLCSVSWFVWYVFAC